MKRPAGTTVRLPIVAALLCFAVAAPARHESVLDHIQRTWDVLTRSNRTLAQAAPDPKFHARPDGRWPVYIPRGESLSRVEAALREQMPPAEFRSIVLRRLPENPKTLAEHGLLYLPHPYVVPGGRFNEMYGWDSYFIQLGLLRDGRIPLARNMADNFLYEIREYGRILNANRTYFLTRSQPPFLTQMLLGVYGRTKDRNWLAHAIPAVEKYYRFWTTAPHLTTETGLSRYYDLGEGPAPEVISSEKDAEGRTHYDRVREFFRTHTVTDYDVSQYYDARTNTLRPLFYKGDRSMRESGFDSSNRFGPFNTDIIHYNPVCLNSLLYLMEIQTAEILRLAGRAEEAPAWERRASARAARVNRLMWDAGAGQYFDWDLVRKRRRPYPFLTTFYPLWAGIATPAQARAVVHNLPLFERPGGLQTSTNRSGSQWDAPFGWAPLQMIAVQGLRRYGYKTEADRIARAFLSLVAEQYRARGAIVEKYDVVRRSIDVSSGIHFGYSSNEAGFGWTNGVFVTLLDELSPEEIDKLHRPR